MDSETARGKVFSLLRGDPEILRLAAIQSPAPEVSRSLVSTYIYNIDSFTIVNCFFFDFQSNIFVYAYSYLPVRLANPLPWQTHLVSDLHKYLTLEVPVTLLSLFVIPVVLAIRKFRPFFTFKSLLSILRTAYYLLSGNEYFSLISSSDLRTITLLVCGLVSLLIQFPINSLKGELVSSAYEQRIQPSECSVTSCAAVGFRGPWFTQSDETSIKSLEEEKNQQASVIKENLRKGCPQASYMASGMVNWTRFALLIKYHTVCDDPQLMKIQVASWTGKLLYEFISISLATQPVCSETFSHGGHVHLEKHLKTAQRALEHDLFKYQHLKASLGITNRYEGRFWDNQKTQQQSSLKKKVMKVIARLEKKYSEYNMFGDEASCYILELRNLKFLSMIFCGISLLIITQLLMELLMVILLESRQAPRVRNCGAMSIRKMIAELK